MTMTCDSVMWYVTDMWQLVTVMYDITLMITLSPKIRKLKLK